MLIFAIACLVAYGVFRYTSRDAQGMPTRGDLGVAIAAAGVVLTALAWLLGLSTNPEAVSREGRDASREGAGISSSRPDAPAAVTSR